MNEGPDGSGKETQTTLLCEHLQREGMQVARFDFPTYGQDPVADLIRSMLRTMQQHWNERSMESRALLYAANRALLKEDLLAALTQPNTVVVCNRYVASNQAHMAAYSENPEAWEQRFQWIEELEYRHLNLPRPDLVILHTMPSAKRAGLLQTREQGKPDAHEANRAYLDRVEQCYHALARREPERWLHISADVDGVVQSPEAVHERVWDALMKYPVLVSHIHFPVRV